jgi:EmrB/QacA subfamily drug resistance transporter
VSREEHDVAARVAPPATLSMRPSMAAAPSPADNRRQAPRNLVLAVCCISLFMVSLDNTIVNVALPSIARSFNASLSSLQWTVDAYLIVLASLLLLSGSLADRFGRKRIFLCGLGVFTTGSFLCGLSPSDNWLIGFRAVQAVGGSMMTPVALAIITNLFTGKAERARAIGYWAAVAAIGIAAGPVLGGVLVDHFGWPSIFWLNLPVGIAAIALTIATVPESHAARSRPFDPLGQILVMSTLVSLTFSIIEGPFRGWADPWIVGGFVAAAAALFGLVHHERRDAEPLVRVELFAIWPFAVAFITALIGFFAFAGLLFTNTLYLQVVRHLSATSAGLLTLPLAVAAMAAVPLSSRLVGRGASRAALVIAGLCLGVAPLLLLRVGLTTNLIWVVVPYAIFGFGYGMLNDPVNDTAVSQLPDSQAAVAASMISTCKQLGQVLGVALAGCLLAARTELGDTTARDGHVWLLLAFCGAGILLLQVTGGGRHRAEPVITLAPGTLRQHLKEMA